jgi:hypothetical protein
VELEQIDPFGLKSPTPLGDISSHGLPGDCHRVEHAVFGCGEDVVPERVRYEELALQKYHVSLLEDYQIKTLLTAKTSASP